MILKILHRPFTKKGFTIIELLLAMSFVAILMIIMAILVVNMINIFTRGVTLRDLNSTARLVMDDMVRSIGASPPITIDSGNPLKNVFLPLSQGGERHGGVFCTGVYSYLWNNINPEGVGDDTIRHVVRWDIDVSGPDTPDSRRIALETLGLLPRPRLIKVMDYGRTFCRTTDNPHLRGDHIVVHIDDIADHIDRPGVAAGMGRVTELLGSSETDLGIVDFQVFHPTASPVNGQVFYSLTFVLGTTQGLLARDGSNLAITPTACRPPVGNISEFNYCAINKFSVAMRTTSRTLVDN